MFLLVILIACTAWLAGLLLPWWSLAIPCLVLGGWFGEGRSSSFLAGFLGIGALWLAQALYIHIANEGILTTRIAELFSLPHPLLVILVTAVTGGLAGGCSALTGYLFMEIFPDKGPTGQPEK